MAEAIKMPFEVFNRVGRKKHGWGSGPPGEGGHVPPHLKYRERIR